MSVSAIYRDDVEVNAAKGGENLRLRLAGVEEEEMQAGFVICSRHVPVPCVTYFQAQLQVHIALAKTSHTQDSLCLREIRLMYVQY